MTTGCAEIGVCRGGGELHPVGRQQTAETLGRRRSVGGDHHPVAGSEQFLDLTDRGGHIADHRFERGLSRVTAEYSLREDGGVRVLNRGFSAGKGEWEEAEGKAYFVKQPDLGYLKVSFFGPFYGSYIVFELDREGYQYSFISGPKTSYLWLLARTPTVSNEVLQRFVERASALGFDTDALILVDQD